MFNAGAACAAGMWDWVRACMHICQEAAPTEGRMQQRATSAPLKPPQTQASVGLPHPPAEPQAAQGSCC